MSIVYVRHVDATFAALLLKCKKWSRSFPEVVPHYLTLCSVGHQCDHCSFAWIVLTICITPSKLSSRVVTKACWRGILTFWLALDQNYQNHSTTGNTVYDTWNWACGLSVGSEMCCQDGMDLQLGSLIFKVSAADVYTVYTVLAGSLVYLVRYLLIQTQLILQTVLQVTFSGVEGVFDAGGC